MPHTPSQTNAEIHFNHDGTPVADAFDDVYFSNDNGLQESQYVFLKQNRLPERWESHPHPQFTIYETGFGTGLNFLLSWQNFIAFKQQHPDSKLRLHFVSFEKFPLTAQDLKLALDAWPELAALSAQLLQHYPPALSGCHRLLFDDVTLDLWLGDVNHCLPELATPQSGLADAWFLDGFAPSKNPEMWQESLFQQMGRLARNDCTVATFTAAGFVRRGLIAAGFEMQKVPGFGRKREMLAGRYHLVKAASITPPEQVAVIGAGLAGSHLCSSLQRRNIRPVVYEQASKPGMAASGNRQGALYPLLNAAHDNLSQFYAQAFGLSRQLVEQQAKRSPQQVSYDWCGVLHYSFNPKQQQKHQQLSNAGMPEQLVYPVSAEQAVELSGIETGHAGVFYPTGGWVNPAGLCQALIANHVAPAAQHLGEKAQITQAENPAEWQIETASNSQQFSHVVFTTGAESTLMPQLQHLPLQSVRGQVSHLPTSPSRAKLQTVVCHAGYATPEWQGEHCVGATFERTRTDDALSQDQHRENLNRFAENLNSPLFMEDELQTLEGRVGFRSRVRDHLPLVGALNTPLSEGLWMLGALGARGVCSAALCAELLASQLSGEPLPVSQQLAQALAADRFAAKQRS